MSKTSLDLDQFTTLLGERQLLEQRVVFISDPINAQVARRATGSLLTLDMMKAGEPITVYLNSPGGDVNSGFSIFDTIRFVKSPVRIVCTGLTASIATVILCATPKGLRFSMPNTKFLIHQPLIPGHIYGQASDLEITAREILKTRQKINELLAKECHQPLEKVEKDTTRDYWMGTDEAVEYGLISKVVEHRDQIKA